VLDVDPEWGTMVVESVIQEYVPHQHCVTVDDDDDAFIYPDPSQSDMQATTTINMSDYVHVESSTS
jgi:hypothetical protein